MAILGTVGALDKNFGGAPRKSVLNHYVTSQTKIKQIQKNMSHNIIMNLSNFWMVFLIIVFCYYLLHSLSCFFLVFTLLAMWVRGGVSTVTANFAYYYYCSSKFVSPRGGPYFTEAPSSCLPRNGMQLILRGNKPKLWPGDSTRWKVNSNQAYRYLYQIHISHQ